MPSLFHSTSSSSFFLYFFKFIYLFIYIWLHWVFVAVCGLSLVVASGATLGCRVWASHCGGFSCCRTRSLECTGSVVVAHGLSCSTACGILPDQARTCVPCIGRRILNHCATREALLFFKHSTSLFHLFFSSNTYTLYK